MQINNGIVTGVLRVIGALRTSNLTSTDATITNINTTLATVGSQLIINPTVAASDFNTGIRINSHVTSGYAATVYLSIGGVKNSVSGVVDGQWIITRATTGNLVIANKSNSENSGLTLYRNGDAPTWNGKPFATGDHTHPYLPLSGGNVTGTINSNIATATHIAGFKGKSIINSTATGYVMLASMNSTNGVFTVGMSSDAFKVLYGSNDLISAGTNTYTKSATILDENGNMTIPGTIKATAGFTGDLTGTALRATADGNGLIINSTYIKDVSFTSESDVNTVTITKGNGATVSKVLPMTNYYPGTGLKLENGNKFSHSNSVTAGTASGSTGALTFGGSFTVPYLSYDAQGHITTAGLRTLSLPSVNMTDTMMTQTLNSDNKEYPVLLSSASTSGTRTGLFGTDITINPSTATVTASAFNGNLLGNAATASKLLNARTISLTGGVTGSGSFDGSGNLTISTTLTAHSHSEYLPLSGGTMTNIITFGGSTNNIGLAWVRQDDAASIVFDAVTDATDNYLVFTVKDDENVNFKWVKKVGSDTITLGTWKREGIRLETGVFIGNLTGNAAMANKLANARTFTLSGAVTGSVSFDGSQNVTINTSITDASGLPYLSTNGGTMTGTIRSTTNNILDTNISGNGVILRQDNTAFYILLKDIGSGSGTAWNTLRPFNIDLHSGLVTMTNGVNAYGGLSTNIITINNGIKISVEGYNTNRVMGDVFSTTDTSQLVRNIIFFKQASGSSDPGVIYHESSGLAGDTDKGVLHICPADGESNTTDYVTIHGYDRTERIKLYTGGRIWTAGNVTAEAGFTGNLTGNADTATIWKTARTITIGNTGKSVNGSANVSWTHAEMGVLPLSGGTMTGPITLNGLIGKRVPTNTDVDTLADGIHYTGSNADTATLTNTFSSITTTTMLSFTPYSAGTDIRKMQIAMDTSSNIGVRAAGSNITNAPWYPILTSKNFKTYAPALNGSGATGTWGISVTGNAATATKLQTARTISMTGDMTGSASFDGSGNVSISTTINTCRGVVRNTNTYPYHLFAQFELNTYSYIDASAICLIDFGYCNGGYGIFRINGRTENTDTDSRFEVNWLVRKGLAEDAIIIAANKTPGATYADAFVKTPGVYACYIIRVLQSARGNYTNRWVLKNSSEQDNGVVESNVYASLEAAGTSLHSAAYNTTVYSSDAGTVKHALNATNSNITDLKTRVTAAETSITTINTTLSKFGTPVNLSIIGSTSISSIGDGTLTGAIAKLNDTKATKTELTSSINTVNSTISTVRSDITAIQNTMKANDEAGLKKWLIKVYNTASLPDENQSFITLDALFGSGLTPDITTTVADASHSTTMTSGSSYIAHAVTFVEFTAASNNTTSFSVKDLGSIYLNGKRITPASSNNNVYLPFVKGWNVIEVIYSVNSTSTSGGFKLGTNFSNYSLCKTMNCYYSTANPVDDLLVQKYAEDQIALDSIRSRLNTAESTLVNKADQDMVNGLRDSLNDTISLVESFKSEYAKITTVDALDARVTKLTDVVNTKVSQTDFNALSTTVGKLKSEWMTELENNGFDCGAVSINPNGFYVNDSSGLYKTTISPSDVRVKYNGDDALYMDGGATVMSSTKIIKGIDMGTMKIVPAKQGTCNGVDFLSSSSIL